MAIIDDTFSVDALSIQDTVVIFQSSTDPRTGAGYDAPVGSLILESTSGHLYVKVSTGVIDWQQIQSGYGINANNASTGVLIGGTLSINSLDNTRFDVSAGAGLIVDNHTDPLNPIAQLISWSASTSIPLTYLTTLDHTYVSLTAAGLIVQSPTTYTNNEHRSSMVLGRIGHSNRTSIVTIINNPDVAFDAAVRLSDLGRALGPINVSGNVFSPNGTNLQINKSAGSVYGTGTNFSTARDNPDTVDNVAYVPTTFKYSYRDGLGGFITGAATTSIDSTKWDDGSGILQTVPNGKFTAQHVIFLVGGEVRIQYGQILYPNLIAGHNVLPDPDFITNPLYNDGGITRAYIILAASVNDLTNTSDALFVEGAKFGGVAGGVYAGSITTLQQAYLNSVIPEIITEQSRGAITIQQGVGVTGNVLEVINSAGVTNFSIDPAGNIATNGTVDGRDVSVDGTVQDSHIADGTIHFTQSAIDHTLLQNIGTHTHAQIDSHIGSTSNPHQTSVVNLTDTTITTPAAGNILYYNNTTSKWINGLPGSASGVQAYDATINSLATLGTGIVVKTAAGVLTARQINGTLSQITVTDGAGILNNPTISITANPVLPGLASVTLPSGATTDRPSPVVGMMRYNTTTALFEFYQGGSWKNIVTSVGLAAPSFLTVTGSPVTSAGTLTLTLATQTAKTVLVGPTTGTAAPTFRQLLIGEMSDVDTTTTAPVATNILSYNGTKWVPNSTLATSASTVLNSWTLVSGNLYYQNFVHNLGTTNIVVSLFDNTTNALVHADSIILTDNNTARVVVAGNSRAIRIVVIANGFTVVGSGAVSSVQGKTGPVLLTPGDLGITLRTLTYYASSLDSPNNADWLINALAPAVSDPTNNAITVRQFSSTVEQGVGGLITIPTGATSMTIRFKGRAQVAPGATAIVQPRLYVRGIPDGAAVSTWSAATELTNISIPTNTLFKYASQTIALSTLSLSPSRLYQFELTRRVTGLVGGTNLSGNWLMVELTIEFN